MAFDLEAALKRSGVTRRVEMTIPDFTRTYEQELVKLYTDTLGAWGVADTRRIVEEYQREISFRDTSEDEVESAAAAILAGLATFTTGWRLWARRGIQWHFRATIRIVKRETKIDMGNILPESIPEPDIEDLLKWNVSLIKDISETQRNRAISILKSASQVRTPTDIVAKEIRDALATSRKRARLIAIDQTVKLKSLLDKERMKALGVKSYLWQHSDKRNYRPEHRARDGDLFKFGDLIDRTDPPGHAPYCGCKRRMVLNYD